MSQGSYDDTIKFRAGAGKRRLASSMRSISAGSISANSPRAGLADMLRRSMTDEDKITLYERYKAGEISREATRPAGEEFDLLRKISKSLPRQPRTIPANILFEWRLRNRNIRFLVDTDAPDRCREQLTMGLYY